MSVFNFWQPLVSPNASNNGVDVNAGLYTTVNSLMPKKAAALTIVIVKAMQQNWA